MYFTLGKAVYIAIFQFTADIHGIPTVRMAETHFLLEVTLKLKWAVRDSLKRLSEIHFPYK